MKQLKKGRAGHTFRGRLRIRLEPAAFPGASNTPTAEEVVFLLQQSRPNPKEMRYENGTEMLIFIESGCEVWRADWGEPNERFRSYYWRRIILVAERGEISTNSRRFG